MVNEDNLVVFVNSAFPKYSLVLVPILICNEFFYVTYCEAVEAFKLLRWLITVEETQSKNW